jgi:hypothetical protein
MPTCSFNANPNCRLRRLSNWNETDSIHPRRQQPQHRGGATSTTRWRCAEIRIFGWVSKPIKTRKLMETTEISATTHFHLRQTFTHRCGAGYTDLSLGANGIHYHRMRVVNGTTSSRRKTTKPVPSPRKNRLRSKTFKTF